MVKQKPLQTRNHYEYPTCHSQQQAPLRPLRSFFFVACKPKKKPSSATSLTDDALMDTVQRRTFNYFWDAAEPNSGLARERYHMDGEYPAGGPEIVTSGGSGFGIMAILAGIDRGYVSREEGLTAYGENSRFSGKKPTALKVHIRIGGTERRDMYSLSDKRITEATW